MKRYTGYQEETKFILLWLDQWFKAHIIECKPLRMSLSGHHYTNFDSRFPQ